MRWDPVETVLAHLWDYVIQQDPIARLDFLQNVDIVLEFAGLTLSVLGRDDRAGLYHADYQAVHNLGSHQKEVSCVHET